MSLYHLILSYDPGLSRLRQAIRTTLSAAISAFILFQLAEWAHQPFTMVYLGITVALYGALMVNDPTVRQRKITVLLLPFPAIMSLLIGTFSASNHILSVGIFLLLTYISVAGRRYGPRFIALSMVAFMSFFGAIYFKAQPTGLPWMILSIVIGSAITYLILFLLPVFSKKWILTWYMGAFEARMAKTLKHLSQSLVNRKNSEKNRLQLRQDLALVSEAALNLEDLLKTGDIISSSALQNQIFEAEFALGRMLESVRSVLQIGNPSSETLSELSLLFKVMAENDPLCFEKIPKIPLNWESPGLNLEPLESLRETISDLVLIRNLKEPLPEIPIPPVLVPTPQYGSDIYTRHAIQATIAVALASIVGGLLSPSRWAWAAITAFVVFSGVNRGDTLIKSALRILGTALGLILGFILVNIDISKNFDVALIFISIFFGTYFIRVAYAWTTMWFSLMLFGLYKFLGLLNPEIIILRLEETSIGVLFATLAALFILPTYAQKSIGSAVATLLRDLASLLDVCSDTQAGKNLTAYSRIIDRDLQAVRVQVQPMLRGFPGPNVERVKGLVHDAFGIVHYGRVLTVSISRHLKDENLRLALHLRCKELAKKALDTANQLEILLQQNQKIDILGKNTLMPLSKGLSDPHSRAHMALDRIELLIDTIIFRFKG